MKQTMKTGLAALALLLAISCKKENSSVQTLSIDSNSSMQNVITDNKILAGNTVRIGTQVWMTKNLDVTRYRNGDKIPQVKGPANWASLTTGAWCWYNNDSATYAATYGRLYNWYAVNDPRGLAIEGWHVPSDAEWTTLSTFLGGEAIAGGKMKEAGTTHWLAPNTYATNSSGFTGLPGGFRLADDGVYYNVGSGGYWWSSTEQEDDPSFAWSRSLYNTLGYIYRAPNIFNKNIGLSVRCVKD